MVLSKLLQKTTRYDMVIYKRFKMEEDLSYYYNPQKDSDFYKIALDIYGSGLRDNTYNQIVQIGKDYHNGIID